MAGLVIAAPTSGAGKTTVALALVAAARRRGLGVAVCKVGPDFIDPAHLARVAGRPVYTLDGWMLGRAACAARLAAMAAAADVVVVEGMMGLFDGVGGASDAGSTAEMARWLGLPVVLVVDAGAMARSVAAVARGFRDFDPGLAVAGVVLNRVGGAGHRALLAEALVAAQAPPSLGALPATEALGLPERHLGLVTAVERSLDPAALAALADRHLDVERLLALARTGRAGKGAPVAARASGSGDPACAEGGDAVRSAAASGASGGDVTIAVARDEAFSFYYPENLELLASAGARIVEFSPLRDSALPAGTAGVYLGGGYPELHAARLAANVPLLAALRRHAAAGGLVYAECGGLMALGAAVVDAEGRRHAMAGVLPFTTRLGRSLTIGYREVTIAEGAFLPPLAARGHEFHAAVVDPASVPPGIRQVYTLHDPASGATAHEGFSAGRTLASWVHLHFASAPALAPALVAAARAGTSDAAKDTVAGAGA